MYWVFIIIGIFLLSISISNPLYKLIIKKYLDTNVFLEFVLRIFIFIFSIIVIFFGLYLESIN